MKRNWFTFCSLLAALSLLAGCVPRLGHNPLEGWKALGSAYVVGCPFGRVIHDDYQNYIRNLTDVEKSSADDFNVHFYEEGARYRAVEITVNLDGTKWKHVLFYDRQDKRINVIKYAGGRYRS